VNILVVVNHSPWGGSLGTTALRLARAMLGEGLSLAAVFFREEGAYHALPGRGSDAGGPALDAAWRELAATHGVPLLVCSSAAARRLPTAPDAPFREAGLAELFELMSRCDRVVSF
jgi:tRNA 2-thiouridine synthesizing protein D